MFHPSNEPAPKIVAFLNWSERPVLIVTALVAGFVLILWLFPSLRAFAPTGWSGMSFLTAVGILLLVNGIALTRSGSSSIAVRSGATSGAVVAALGGTIIALDAIGVAELASVELPSPQTSFAFMIIGLGLAFLRKREAWIDYLLLLLWGFLIFMIGGHLFESERMIASIDGRLISVQTIVCFVGAAFVLTGRRALDGGPFGILVTLGMGSKITRVMLPVAVLAPFLVFYLVQQLYSSEVLPAALTRSLVSPIVVIGVLGLIGWMGVRINRLERALQQQSVTDEMTKVLNKRGFEAVSEFVVATARRSNECLTVYFFDLDGLKGINDSLGHKAGNEAIVRFASLLRSTYRHSDIVARVGGDEFAALAIGDKESATATMSRLEAAVQKENSGGRHAFRLAYSVGFSVIRSSEDLQVDTALARADAFMYEQKRLKKSRQAARAVPTRRVDQPAPARTAADWSI